MTELRRFFLESSWMVLATTVGGLLMWAVHVPAARGMSGAEYGVFVMFLQLMNLWLIPAVGLQTIFAQQAASAVTEDSLRRLRTRVRVVLGGAIVLWVLVAVPVKVWEDVILRSMKIPEPQAIWLMMGIALAMLWWPLFQGLLQGRQEFFWLGWLQIINGGVRFALVVLFVTLFRFGLCGAMLAVFCAFWVCVGLAFLRSIDLLRGAGGRVEWADFLARAIPLSIGLGSGYFLMAADQIAVQRWFPAEMTGIYGAAGMIGRALVFFTVPMVAVMFPKVVRSTVLGTKGTVLFQAFLAVALLGGGAAAVCTLFPVLPLKIVYSEPYWKAAPLVPWFVWAMWPLTLGNVLVGFLLGRGLYGIVCWLVIVVVGYAVALLVLVPRLASGDIMNGFLSVVKLVGVFNSLYAASAAWFTWRVEKGGLLKSNGRDCESDCR